MPTTETLHPTDSEQLREIVVNAAGSGCILEMRSGGSKRDIGTPERDSALVDLGAFKGVIDYEPSELVLTARPATPLHEIETLLDTRGQMLAFEPWDHGPLFGRSAGAATIGGIAAAGVAGSRRITAGGARDHLLGFAAISGRGEAFRAGGKVVKNVTGYDVAKVMAGSWGQLAILTELTFKVVPRPRATRTVALRGLSAPAAVAAMSKAIGSSCAAAAAAHLPGANDAPSLTGIRIEGFRESVDVRAKQLEEVLADFAKAASMNEDEASGFWSAIRDAQPLSAAETLWRAHVAPSRAAALVDALERFEAQWIFDWAGALIWVGAPAAVDIRALAEAHGGHALLVRAPIDLRRITPARREGSAAVAALATRLKQVFDPSGVLDPMRFA